MSTPKGGMTDWIGALQREGLSTSEIKAEGSSPRPSARERPWSKGYRRSRGRMPPWIAPSPVREAEGRPLRGTNPHALRAVQAFNKDHRGCRLSGRPSSTTLADGLRRNGRTELVEPPFVARTLSETGGAAMVCSFLGYLRRRNRCGGSWFERAT